MKLKKVAIIVPGLLPVPSVKGGAIETLITGFLAENEKKRLIDISVFSAYNKTAVLQSKKYPNTQFVWIKYSCINKVINIITRLYTIITKKNVPHFGVLQIIHKLKMGTFDLVVIEGNDQQIVPISKVVRIENTYFHLHARLFSTPDIYDSCTKVITVSNYIRNQVLLNTNKKEKDVVVLKNCTDISLFSRDNNIQSRDNIRNKYGISKTDVVICYTGRIVKEKGVDELIQSLLLLPENLMFKLFIVGSSGSAFGLANGSSEYFTKVSILAGKLKNKVIFTGFMHNSEIPHILASSDISAIPSIYEEPGALTVFENLAAGLPIVTTDSGGIPEYVTEDCAIIIRRDQNLITNLSKALIELITSKEKREAMGQAGLKHVQQFSYENYYNDFLEIINESPSNMRSCN